MALEDWLALIGFLKLVLNISIPEYLLQHPFNFSLHPLASPPPARQDLYASLQVLTNGWEQKHLLFGLAPVPVQHDS